MGKLEGRVAIVTGAGSGIGRCAALLFAAEGAAMVVADYVAQGGRETVTKIIESGGQAIFVKADVSQSGDVQRMIQATLDAFGRLDILFNNAGIQGKHLITADTPEEAWDAIMATNLKGVFLAAKYALPVMLTQGGGVIINTASSAGLVGHPGLVAYSASKAGVIQMTKVMALEYAGMNIRVNCICPGGINTAMTDTQAADTSHPAPYRQPLAMRRMGRPEEVARAALYLACDDSSYVTGTAMVVDGGWTAGLPAYWPKK